MTPSPYISRLLLLITLSACAVEPVRVITVDPLAVKLGSMVADYNVIFLFLGNNLASILPDDSRVGSPSLPALDERRGYNGDINAYFLNSDTESSSGVRTPSDGRSGTSSPSLRSRTSSQSLRSRTSSQSLRSRTSSARMRPTGSPSNSRPGSPTGSIYSLHSSRSSEIGYASSDVLSDGDYTDSFRLDNACSHIDVTLTEPVFLKEGKDVRELFLEMRMLTRYICSLTADDFRNVAARIPLPDIPAPEGHQPEGMTRPSHTDHTRVTGHDLRALREAAERAHFFAKGIAAKPRHRTSPVPPIIFGYLCDQLAITLRAFLLIAKPDVPFPDKGNVDLASTAINEATATIISLLSHVVPARRIRA